jgi:hypothetical protein
MTLKASFKSLAAFAIVLGLTAASGRADETYYTKVGFAYEKGRHLTTNYWKGTRVPLNTEVKVVGKSGGAIKIEIEPGKDVVQIKNVEKHSKVGIDTIFARYFSAAKTPETDLTPAFLEDIKAGKVTIGMTKKDVLASVGYPPAHQTPSLEGDAWKYWANRFSTTLVTFKDGKVSEIKE